MLDLSYKMYVRSHLNYVDVFFHNKRMELMEGVQHNQSINQSIKIYSVNNTLQGGSKVAWAIPRRLLLSRD